MELTQEEKVNKIYDALIGDNLGNKGLVKRVEEVEQYISGQKKMMAKVSGATLALLSLGGVIVWGLEKLWQYLSS